MEINRRPLARAPEHERVRVIFCGGHHAGWATLSAFVEPWNWCYANCEVVAVVPDRKDIPSARGSLWRYDNSKWRINLVPKLARTHDLPVHRLDLWPGPLFNRQLLKLAKRVGAQAILSSTFRGIFRQEVIDLVGGRAFNIHPTGIAVDREGRPDIRWPQPLFEGKGAFDLMFEMNKKFKKGQSPLDCQAMEWIIHRIAAPPRIDQGEFVGANECPIPLPHEEQEGRDQRKRKNGAQSHCAAAIPELMHKFGPHLFRGAPPPWDDPRLNPTLSLREDRPC